MSQAPKVAIVHDWLTNMGGAEPVVLELHKMFPDAPIYTSVYNEKKMPAFAGCNVRTTYLQKILPPFIRYKHVLWPVLRAFAFRKLDLSQYDIIISSASAEAKSVKKRPGAIHICYCHTPTRYYWSHYQEFKKQFNFGPLTLFIRPFVPLFVHWMRRLDLKATASVDYFIANSNVTKQRIKTYYKRDSAVIFPPVEVERFANHHKAGQRSGYIMWGRHVPYKRFDLAIQACNKLGESLTIAGSGPDTERLKKLAGPTIKFVGRVSDQKLVDLAHQAKAFLFPNEEDFGISAVEAQAAGLPVIAYAQGGALDIVKDGVTGVLFYEQTVEALIAAIKKCDSVAFNQEGLQTHVKSFNKDHFANSLQKFIAEIESF